MTKLKLLIVVSLLAISYSNAQNKFFVEDDLFHIVNEVVNDLRGEGLWNGVTENFVVKFYKKRPNNQRAAAAYANGNDKVTFILVNGRVWSTLNSYQKRFVIMHELGHDYYNLGHTEDEDNIMRHNVPNNMDVFDLKEYKQTFYETIRATRSN